MDLVELIANTGFPMALSIYLLLRFEGKMESLTKSIDDLTDAILKGDK